MTMSRPGHEQNPSQTADIRGGPSRAWYVLALLIALLSTAGIIATVYQTIRSFPQGTRFLAPGSVTVAVRQPGTHVLWNELSAFYEGKHYPGSEELPAGIEIRARELSTGGEAEFSPAQGGTETIGTVQRKAVGELSFAAPGTYVIEVSGSFPERVFYLRGAVFPAVWRGLALIAGLGFAGFIAAPVLAVIVFAKRSAACGPARPAAPPADSATAGMGDEERTYAMFCHLAGLSGFFVPFGNVFVPLILWLTKRDSSTFIDQHGRESLNFQLSLLLYTFFSALLILLVIGIFLLAGLMFFSLVIVIIAAVRAKNGAPFRYPLTIRFIR